MNKVYQRWVLSFLAALLILLMLCASTVYIVDPCLYFRMPKHWKPVFFNERYQAAGIIKHVPADTVLMGTSMVANTRASAAAEAFGGTAIRITIPDGRFSEFDQAVNLLFREQAPERLVFGIDLNILVRDDGGKTAAMPGYLYNRNPLDDLKYLLNKDALYYSAYVLLSNAQGNAQPIDDAFIWTDGTVWERYEALRMYERPRASSNILPQDTYLSAVDRNLAIMESWFQAHPSVEFDLFFSPYSILFWDKSIRQGDLDARFAALKRSCEVLTAYENVGLYGLLFDREFITDLDNYCDYVHHSGEAGRQVLEKIAFGNHRLTAENMNEALADWREFVVNYDYESLWDQAFWERWYKGHDEPPAWLEKEENR